MQALFLASSNQGKLAELRALIQAEVEIKCPQDLGAHEAPEETGSTFKENAIIKATKYASLSGLPSLADDSGLEVVALDHRPGVHSARYAGPSATDQDNVDKLLEELSKVDDEKRQARFVCSMAFVSPDGELVATSSGTVDGLILRERVGQGGFGYDPVFWHKESQMSFAELSGIQKNQLSHRGKALRLILPSVLNFIR